MKRIELFKKLNRATAIKVALIAVLIIVIEAICGVLIYSTYNAYIHDTIYSDYKSSIAFVSTDTGEKLGEEVSVIGSSDVAYDHVKEVLAQHTNFDNFVIFTEASSGRIIGDDWLVKDNLSNYGINYASTQLVTIDDTCYVFVSQKIGSSAFYVGALVDFTEQQLAIKGLLNNVVALLVIASLLVLVAFFFYASWTGVKERNGKFDYKLTISGDGSIQKCNRKFKLDFPDSKSIKSNLAELNEKFYNIFRLNGATGEKLLVAKLKSKRKNSISIHASVVDNASAIVDFEGTELTVSSKARASIRKAYEEFSKKGKRTLIGVLNITNLNVISALFGKEMALDIQKVVLKKVKEKFAYSYELDLGMIGIVYPDGKKLDILLSDLPDHLNYISQPIHEDDNLFTINLRSGFALCDATMQDRSFEYAIKAADAARQRAIDTGVADYIIYHESQKKLYTKYFIKFDIKQMIQEGAFEMEYQPQYGIKDNRIVGFEALFRVKKNWNVNIDTFSFITYAERTGAMVQLGEFIFDTAMKFAKKLEGKNVSVSLNVSPVQFMQNGFADNFLKIYKKYELKPGSICVEITESFLMKNFADTLKKLEMLKKNGINVHLDDFGVEYSSLLYIKELPISTIKIDRGFIKDIAESKQSQAIVKFITNIANLLNLTTICEGVETSEEYDLAKSLGCDIIQGWLIGRSMKPDTALKMVDEYVYDDKNRKITG